MMEIWKEKIKTFEISLIPEDASLCLPFVFKWNVPKTILPAAELGLLLCGLE